MFLKMGADSSWEVNTEHDWTRSTVVTDARIAGASTEKRVIKHHDPWLTLEHTISHGLKKAVNTSQMKMQRELNINSKKTLKSSKNKSRKH